MIERLVRRPFHYAWLMVVVTTWSGYDYVKRAIKLLGSGR